MKGAGLTIMNLYDRDSNVLYQSADTKNYKELVQSAIQSIDEVVGHDTTR